MSRAALLLSAGTDFTLPQGAISAAHGINQAPRNMGLATLLGGQGKGSGEEQPSQSLLPCLASLQDPGAVRPLWHVRVRTCGCPQDHDEMAGVGSSCPFLLRHLGRAPGSPCPVSPFQWNVSLALGAWEEGEGPWKETFSFFSLRSPKSYPTLVREIKRGNSP